MALSRSKRPARASPVRSIRLHPGMISSHTGAEAEAPMPMHPTLSLPRADPIQSRPKRSRRVTSKPDTNSSFVEVRLRSPPSTHWMGQIVEKFGGRARVLLCRPTGPGEGKMLRVVEVSAPPEKMEAIVRFARRSASKGTMTIDARAAHRIMLWVVEPTPPACAAVFHAGAVCASCPLFPRADVPQEDGQDWSLLLPRMSPRAKALLKVFGPHDGASALLRVGGIAPEAEMTSRQERAVETAFRMGYFDHPRRAGLREVAVALGVSRSTTLELLRRGLTKVLARREAQGVPGFAGD